MDRPLRKLKHAEDVTIFGISDVKRSEVERSLICGPNKPSQSKQFLKAEAEQKETYSQCPVTVPVRVGTRGRR